MQRCPFCGSTDLITDPARGDTVCGSCGEILQEGAIVAETTWVHSAGGSAFAAGKEVQWGGFAGSNQSSQELAVARGITKLSFIADRLQLSTQIQEAGRRMYQLAVQMNFTAGRRSSCVASACLYVVCRRSLSPHLLIDFSDILQLPVKVIGQVYLRLVRRLVGADPRCPTPLGNAVVEVPVVDPSIFIERFSQKLDFGSSRRKVMNTALRLIQFMHRDWICVGRRPNGLCGAALLVASFYHGQSISAKDIANVVRMHEGTIRRRLYEMRQTPLAAVPAADIDKVTTADVPAAEHPPCMQERRRREALAAIMDDGLKPPLALNNGEALACQEMPPPPAPSRKRVKRSPELPLEDSQPGRAARYTAREPSAEDIEAMAREVAAQHHIEEIIEKGSSVPSAGWNTAAARVEELLTGKPLSFGMEEGDSASQPSECQEETLSDVDDEELDTYLLQDDEREAKSDIWHEVNKDYLEEWYHRDREERRRSQRQASRKGSNNSEAPLDSTSETGSSCGGSRRGKKLPSTSSCTQSAVLALTRKSKVGRNRINIEALERLFE